MKTASKKGYTLKLSEQRKLPFYLVAAALMFAGCTSGSEEAEPTTTTVTETEVVESTTTTLTPPLTLNRSPVQVSASKEDTLIVNPLPRVCEADGTQFFCPDLFLSSTQNVYNETFCDIDNFDMEWGKIYTILAKIEGVDTRIDGSGCGPSIEVLRVISEEFQAETANYLIRDFSSMTENSLMGLPVKWESDTFDRVARAEERGVGGVITIRAEVGVLYITGTSV